MSIFSNVEIFLFLGWVRSSCRKLCDQNTQIVLRLTLVANAFFESGILGQCSGALNIVELNASRKFMEDGPIFYFGNSFFRTVFFSLCFKPWAIVFSQTKSDAYQFCCMSYDLM